MAGQHVEFATGRIEQHTDLEAAGADGRASLPDAGHLFVEVAVEPDVHAVGVGERHIDRRPRRCPDHDRWDGGAVDDVAQTSERHGRAVERLGARVDRPDRSDLVAQRLASIVDGAAEFAADRLVLDGEPRTRSRPRSQPEAHASGSDRLQRVERRHELHGVAIDHVRHQQTELDPFGHGGHRTEGDERIARPRGAVDGPAEVIGHPQHADVGVVEGAGHVDQVGHVRTEHGGEHVDDHDAPPNMRVTSPRAGRTAAPPARPPSPAPRRRRRGSRRPMRVPVRLRCRRRWPERRWCRRAATDRSDRTTT